MQLAAFQLHSNKLIYLIAFMSSILMIYLFSQISYILPLVSISTIFQALQLITYPMIFIFLEHIEKTEKNKLSDSASMPNRLDGN
ncbi:hypothetical protein A7P95_01640 [Eikenella longinqua]|uniref:Uncharacterized protein n=1 Tax=Eikenella longinqua TaxID=1795827 RepID=A0A1A9S1G1_9NEIS|nr:hypothetical protein A7P95_01640 [Eikenella longinqua]